MFKRLICGITALLMICATIPFPVYAEDTTGNGTSIVQSTVKKTSSGYLVSDDNGITTFNGIPIANKSYTVSSEIIPESFYMLPKEICNGSDFIIYRKNNTIEEAGTTAEWYTGKAIERLITDNSDLDIKVFIAYMTTSSTELYNTIENYKGTCLEADYGTNDFCTGTCIMLSSRTLTNEELISKLKDKLTSYNFIIRYPEGKESSTGYKDVPSGSNAKGYITLKYIRDSELCSKINNSGKSLEEFLGIKADGTKDTFTESSNAENTVNNDVQTALENQEIEAEESELSGMTQTQKEAFVILTNKYITQTELQAMEWNLVLSQFAVPYKENIQDVWNHKSFKQMRNQGLVFDDNPYLTSIENNLKVLDSSKMSEAIDLGITLNGDSTTKTKMAELYNVMSEQDGATYSPVYTNDNKIAYVSDLFDNKNTALLIKDKISVVGDATSRTELWDALKTMQENYLTSDHSREEIATAVKSGSNTYDVKVPVWINTDSVMMYNAIFVANAIRMGGYSTFSNFMQSIGNSQLYMDRWGNLCANTRVNGELKMCIVYPAYANPIFISTETDDDDLVGYVYEDFDKSDSWESAGNNQFVYSSEKALKTYEEIKSNYISGGLTNLSNNDYLGEEESLSRSFDLAVTSSGKYFSGTYNRLSKNYLQSRDLIPIIEVDNTDNMLFNKAVLSSYSRDTISKVTDGEGEGTVSKYYQDDWYKCLNDRNNSYSPFADSDLYTANAKDSLFSNSLVFDKYYTNALFTIDGSESKVDNYPSIVLQDDSKEKIDIPSTKLSVSNWDYNSNSYEVSSSNPYLQVSTDGAKIKDSSITGASTVLSLYPFMQMHSFRKGLYSNTPSLQPNIYQSSVGDAKGLVNKAKTAVSEALDVGVLNMLIEDRLVSDSWKYENTIANENDNDSKYTYLEVIWNALYSDSDKYKTYCVLNYTDSVVPSNSSIYGLGHRLTKANQSKLSYIAIYLDSIVNLKAGVAVGKNYMSIPILDTVIDDGSQWKVFESSDSDIIDSVQLGTRERSDSNLFSVKKSDRDTTTFFEPIAITGDNELTALRYILNDQRVSDVLESYPKEDITLLSFVWRNYYTPQTPFRTKLNTIIPTEVTGSTSQSTENTTLEVDNLKVINELLSNDFSITANASGKLSGVKIGIDPGHQQQGDMSSEKKGITKAPPELGIPESSEQCSFRVKSGCTLVNDSGTGVATDEYKVCLEISLKLQKALEAEGATVVMTRTTNDVNISNYERAQLLNDANVDVSIRIHVDSVENSPSTNGFTSYVPKTDGGQYVRSEESKKFAEVLNKNYESATGLKNNGVKSDNAYVGSNWSIKPCVLFETGFGSNVNDSKFLRSEEGQNKVVTGLTNGFIEYFTGKTVTAENTSTTVTSSESEVSVTTKSKSEQKEEDDGKVFTYTLKCDNTIIPVITKDSFISKYSAITPYNIISEDGSNVNNTLIWTNACSIENENKLSPGIVSVGKLGSGELSSLTVSNTTINRVSYNFGELLLAVNKNSEGDNLVRMISEYEEDKQFNTVDIGNAIQAFFLHPVITISTLYSGFLQFIHNNVSKGSISNVFDISWVSSTIMSKGFLMYYIAISSALCSIVLIIRGIKYLISRDSVLQNLIMDWTKAVALSVVPVILLNFVSLSLSVMADYMTHGISSKLSAIEIEKEVASSENLNINFETVYQAYKEQFDTISDNYTDLDLEIPVSWNPYTNKMTYDTVSLKELYDTIEYSNVLSKAKLEASNLEVVSKLEEDDTPENDNQSVLESVEKMTELANLYKNQNPSVTHMYYSYSEFVPVNYDKYSSNIFYYFYDYIKYQYLAYWAQKSDSNSATYSSAAKNFTLPDVSNYEKWSSYINRMWDAERYMLLKSYNGMYIMMHDDAYNYNKLYDEKGRQLYKGGYPTDMFGLSYLFNMTDLSLSDNGYTGLPGSDYIVVLNETLSDDTKEDYSQLTSWQEKVKTSFSRTASNYGSLLSSLEKAERFNRTQTITNFYPLAYLMDNPSWGMITKYNDTITRNYNSGLFEDYSFTPTYMYNTFSNKDCYADFINPSELRPDTYVSYMDSDTYKDIYSYVNMKGKRIPYRPYASKSTLYSTTLNNNVYEKETTKFEETLMKINTNIYKQLRDLTEYLQGDIRDSSLIFTAALIATMEFNKEFTTPIISEKQLKPQSFTLDTMTLDKFIRLTYAKSIDEIVKNTDVVYMIYEQDAGVLTATCVVGYELLIYFTMITRIGILLLMFLGCMFICFSYVIGKLEVSHSMIRGLLIQLLQIFISQFILLTVVLYGVDFISSVNNGYARLVLSLVTFIILIALLRWSIYMFIALFKDFKDFGGAVIQGGIESLRANMTSQLADIANNRAINNVQAVVKNAGLTPAVEKVNDNPRAVNNRALLSSIYDNIASKTDVRYAKVPSLDERISNSRGLLSRIGSKKDD